MAFCVIFYLLTEINTFLTIRLCIMTMVCGTLSVVSTQKRVDMTMNTWYFVDIIL